MANKIVPQGLFGQLRGPFTAGENIKQTKMQNDNSSIYTFLGISIAEKDFMLFGKNEENETQPYSLRFMINGEEFWIGRTQMYETSQEIELNSLVFPDGAPASTLIEYRLSKIDGE